MTPAETPVFDVYVDNQLSGHLMVTPDDRYVFRYTTNDPKLFVSLSLPIDEQATEPQERIPRVFLQNLPEGALMSTLRRRLEKLIKIDDETMLGVIGRGSFSRINCVKHGESFAEVKQNELPLNITLRDVMDKDSHEIFSAIYARLAETSFLAGQQPKVTAQDEDGRRIVMTNSIIIKSSGGRQSFDCVNEYVCHLIARDAGLMVPATGLSHDGGALIAARFDVAYGRPIGFEDFGSLLNTNKYEGSYENIANFLRKHSSDPSADLERFYVGAVINHLVSNGDAHNKNFGVIYTDTTNVRLAPFYDITSTNGDFDDDVPALLWENGQSRLAWLSQDELIDWGSHFCDVPVHRGRDIIHRCIETVKNVAVLNYEQYARYMQRTKASGTNREQSRDFQSIKYAYLFSEKLAQHSLAWLANDTIAMREIAATQELSVNYA